MINKLCCSIQAGLRYCLLPIGVVNSHRWFTGALQRSKLFSASFIFLNDYDLFALSTAEQPHLHYKPGILS